MEKKVRADSGVKPEPARTAQKSDKPARPVVEMNADDTEEGQHIRDNLVVTETGNENTSFVTIQS